MVDDLFQAACLAFEAEELLAQAVVVEEFDAGAVDQRHEASVYSAPFGVKIAQARNAATTTGRTTRHRLGRPRASERFRNAHVAHTAQTIWKPRMKQNDPRRTRGLLGGAS